MSKATIWLEYWYCTSEWQLCLSLSEDPNDVDCFPIDHIDAKHLKQRGVTSRGMIFVQSEAGRRPRHV